jgi:hypothetical protein
LYEVLATPLTYAVVYWLKSAEKVDAFDYHTSFNPFRIHSNPELVEAAEPPAPAIH